MTYQDFLKGVSFRFVQPQSRVRRPIVAASKLLRALGARLEIVNTRLPEDASKLKHRIGPLCNIPRMSTFAIGAMLNRGVSQLPHGESFVNVGVWHGFTFLSALKENTDKTCIGIDNFSQFGGPRDEFLQRFSTQKGPNHHFHDMDYKEYFAKVHKGPIGYYVYDGEHSYQNQLDGLLVAEPFFSDRCVILVDDTNFDEPKKATLDFMARSPGKYKLIYDQGTACNGHPTLWNGLMVLQRTGR